MGAWPRFSDTGALVVSHRRFAACLTVRTGGGADQGTPKRLIIGQEANQKKEKLK